MPELPEVETVKRGLAPVMEGFRFTAVEQRRANLRFPFPEKFVERLVGRTLTKLDRRAKYLVGHIDSGEVLVMHLGMSGRFTIAQLGGTNASVIGEFANEAGCDGKHDHVVFHMSGGATVTYNDARRFGAMTLVDAGHLTEHALFAELGIEPLGPDLTASYLAARAAGKKVDLKAFLMDQRIVAGLGNIYVCEALFRACLAPMKRARILATRSGMPTPAAERLVPVIKNILEAAILAGGSTLRDYQQADGELGYFQHSFDVYGRAGEACRAPGCKSTIRRIVQAGRSTFYCPVCQR